VDQLVEIIKVLGTPTKEEIHAMNPNYTEFKFPQIKAHPWTKVFSKRMPPDAIDLVSNTFLWSHCLLAFADCQAHVNMDWRSPRPDGCLLSLQMYDAWRNDIA
jgi:hypothetical protein